jgi:hypothetical protein
MVGSVSSSKRSCQQQKLSNVECKASPLYADDVNLLGGSTKYHENTEALSDVIKEAGLEVNAEILVPK